MGVQKRFDLFGVLFLAFVVAVVGGMMCDVLVGAVPPVAITDIHYFAIAMIGGVLTFYCYPNVTSHQRPILLLDAVGLALFAVIGAKSDRSWNQSVDGRNIGHVDWNRWRDDP